MKDALRVAAEDRAGTALAPGGQPLVVVPESTDLHSLLIELQRQGQTMAIVLDEFGNESGIVTIEDIVEEVLGEIEDEYDPPAVRLATPTGTGVYEADGRIRGPELLEATGFEMPDGRYDTLAGLLIMRFQRVPDVGDRVEIDGWRFQVLEMDGPRIAQVLLTSPARLRGRA